MAKHLRLLEDAGLVVSRRRGREKLHYLNPVPIRLLHDRWVSKYTEPWAAGLTGLKTELETHMEKVFEIYIRTTPERLWEAITDPTIRAKYHFGARIESDWTPGSPYALNHPGADGPLVEGENLVVDPPRRLVQTMHAMWGEDAEREATSRVTWEIEPVGDSCRLTVTHDQLSDDRPGGALRRLADDPVRAEDLARDRRDPHHPGLADVRRALSRKGDRRCHRPPSTTSARSASPSPTRTPPSSSTSPTSASRSGSMPRSARRCAGSRSPRQVRSTSIALAGHRGRGGRRRRHRDPVHGARRRSGARRDAASAA